MFSSVGGLSSKVFELGDRYVLFQWDSQKKYILFTSGRSRRVLFLFLLSFLIICGCLTQTLLLVSYFSCDELVRLKQRNMGSSSAHMVAFAETL